MQDLSICKSLLGLLFYLVLLVIYRLTFHPLARFPGPLLSKITSFSIFLQANTGDRHLIHLAEHRKYGPIVRIAPNQLSFADPPALRSIYQSARASNPLRKAEWYETVDAPSGAYSTHTEISRTKHAFRRRVMEQAFSDSALRTFEPLVTENVETLLRLIEEQPEQNMSTLATHFTYDVMGDLVFGKRFNCMTSPEHRFMPKLIMASSASIYAIAHLPFQFLVRPIICSQTLVRLFGGQLEKDGLAYIAYANDRVTERLEAESSPDHKPRHDLMHHLIHARDPQTNAPFTRRDLDAESSLLIAAGADTTSTTLAAALFYLTLPSSQAILSDLTIQLRSQFSTVESIRGQAITSQPLLRAIIDESLRLSPSVPTHLPRTIVQNPGITIAGHFIPKGTTVGCAAYVLHRDPLAFPRADEFLPERWLVDEDAEDGSLRCKEQVDKAREAFCAFSLGSRGCVGKGLAYLELAMVLGRVLWEFDVVMVEGRKEVTVRTVEEGRKRGWKVSGEEFQLKDSFLAERDGPVVKFVKRR